MTSYFLLLAEIQNLYRNRRQVVSTKNITEAKDTAETTIKISKHLLSQVRTHLCQSKSVTCSSGPPGPPGPPGTKGTRGRRGQKGRTGNTITWKNLSPVNRDPGTTIPESRLTGLAWLSRNNKVDFCCV